MSKPQVKIEWLTKSPAMKAYFDGVEDVQFTGGTLYEIDAINCIGAAYPIAFNQAYIKRENALKYLLKNHKKSIDADICVTDPYVLAFGKLDYSKYNIAIIHHIDDNLGTSFFGKVFLKRLMKNLKKVDLVIVVSEYWKEYLEKQDIKNIKVIYNSYNLSDFDFTQNEIEHLKKRLDLDDKKPTLYLGKMGQGKGVENILKHIDHSKFNLITSGKSKSLSENVKSFFLSKSEFPMLLKISDVVLAMSTMPEGWNRIAHEALLTKTPVIGSGTGGMKELLEKSGQKIVSDLAKLEFEVDDCIAKKQELGNIGFNFVRQFDMPYFQTEWLNVIKQIEQNFNPKN